MTWLAVCLQVSAGPSPEDLQLQSIAASVRLDPRVREQHLRNCNIAELYAKTGTGHRQELRPEDLAAAGRAPDLSAVDAAAAAGGQRLTYQRLVEAPSLVRAVDMVVQVSYRSRVMAGDGLTRMRLGIDGVACLPWPASLLTPRTWDVPIPAHCHVYRRFASISSTSTRACCPAASHPASSSACCWTTAAAW